MPTWGEILREFGASASQREGKPDSDAIRRKYLTQLATYTGRNLILYASKWTQIDPVLAQDPEAISIREQDIQGLMEVVHGLSGRNVDLILHSPGGSADAAEAFVLYLRSKFRHLRVFVPYAAMSAATMMACAADRIVMGNHSFLGPIDAQVVLSTALGRRMVPAQAILDQFGKAQEDCGNPDTFRAWVPILPQYGPDVLMTCQNALDLSKGLVAEWLGNYMFRRDSDGREKSERIAEWLGRHGNFKSHGKHLSASLLREQGLKIDRLESDQTLQDLVLSVFHATTITFESTPTVKIIENQNGKAFVNMVHRVALTGPELVGGTPAPPPSALPTDPSEALAT